MGRSIQEAMESIAKYEITKDSKQIKHPITEQYVRVYRIKALRSFVNIHPVDGSKFTVNKGDWGGYVQNESNLSHEGTCWLGGNATMLDKAYRCEDSLGIFNSIQCENSLQSGNSFQTGSSIQSGRSKQSGCSKQMDFSHQSGNSHQTGNSKQQGRSTQAGNSIQDGNSTQMGFSKQYGDSKQLGNSRQTGHSRQFDSSTQTDNSLQADFSKQYGFSQQCGSSQQGSKSEQFGRSVQDGDSRQIGYSRQMGNFVHNHGPHSTYSDKGTLGLASDFIEIAHYGSLSLGMNYDRETGLITTTTGYVLRSSEEGAKLLHDFFDTLKSPISDEEIRHYLRSFRLLMHYHLNFYQGH